ncbi:MAG: SHOCT domain-containing protein [Candidatus Limnocylindrales bacterium]
MQIHDGLGLGAGLFWLVVAAAFLLFWGLVIAALVLGVRWLLRAERQGSAPPAAPGPPPAAAGPGAPPDPLAILRERYARGEIDEEEYERRRRTLSG